MAMSPSPQPSSMMGRRLRQESMSPVPQPATLSKKDKKRDQIKTGYTQRREDFSRDRDNHYRTALLTLQIDMNLITAADPYQDETLTNDPDEIDRLVRDCIQQSMSRKFSNEPPPQSGRIYAEFAKQCNDAAEQRDASLVTLKRDIDVKLAELESEHTYRKKLAQLEYNALATTLRDRLINSVTSKKNRLMKEKEMDIGESTAMLLHPSQYGVANPSSPSGIHNKRTTRRGRDIEEPATFPESNKRKRKAIDHDDSPAPTRPRLDNGNGTHTPLEREWLAEKKHLTETQIEAALYSVEKLFTEKELAMTYNSAAVAAHNHMLRHSGAGNLENPANGTSSSASENGRPAAETNEADDVDSQALGGLAMERTGSQINTRSTRGNGGGNFAGSYGMDALDDSVSLSLSNVQANVSAISRQIPKLPTIVSLTTATRTVATKNEIAPQPLGLHADDLAAELDAIRRARNHNDAHGLGNNLTADPTAREMLEVASQPKTVSKHAPNWRWIETKHSRPSVPITMANGNGVGGQPMSRNASQQ